MEVVMFPAYIFRLWEELRLAVLTWRNADSFTNFNSTIYFNTMRNVPSNKKNFNPVVPGFTLPINWTKGSKITRVHSQNLLSSNSLCPFYWQRRPTYFSFFLSVLSLLAPFFLWRLVLVPHFSSVIWGLFTPYFPRSVRVTVLLWTFLNIECQAKAKIINWYAVSLNLTEQN